MRCEGGRAIEVAGATPGSEGDELSRRVPEHAESTSVYAVRDGVPWLQVVSTPFLRGRKPAMSWNYRVVHTTEGGAEAFAIYEVYYDEQGQPEDRTAQPGYPAGETLAELRDDLRHYLRALEQPVLEDTSFRRTDLPEG